MRALPAGWPDPTAPVQTPPVVYLHVLDSIWPPASTQGKEALPAGWSRVGTWSIDCELDAPLMPGQVNSTSNYTVATGACTIPNPPGGMLAPWRTHGERTPSSGHCELVASYDGYDGDTAFVLGKFMLRPMKGKASSASVSLTLIQDLVRLRKDHDLPTQVPWSGEHNSFGNPVSPTRFLEIAAANNGYTLETSGDFPSIVTSLYFPIKTDELKAIQTIVSANLGAVFQTLDGSTIKVLTADDLLGTGTPDQTLNVLTSFDDLTWGQDPNAQVDRIEVTYVPPQYVSPTAIKTYAKGRKFSTDNSIDIGDAWFDPKRAILYPNGPFGSINLIGPSGPEIGSFGIFQRSSGAAAVGIVVAEVGEYSIDADTKVELQGNISGSEDAVTLSWGLSAEDATNILTFDLGGMIQRRQDAQEILHRIVTRVSSPSYVIDDVRVVPHLGRELADLYRIDLTSAGLSTRVMVTGISLSGGPDGTVQTLSLAALGLTLDDFDAAWDAAMAGATIDDFDAAWDAAFPGATIDDFDSDPLKT